MNGEQSEFLREIDNRIVKLETLVQGEIETNKEQKETTRRVFNKLDSLPCEGRGEKIEAITSSVNKLWMIIIWGVIVTVIGGVARVVIAQII